MRKKVKFIYNPYSGENKIISNLDYIIKEYQGKGFDIIPFRLTSEYSIEEALEGVNEEFDHILAAGGDGTINSVVNTMKLLNVNVPLAVLPAGTANDFAKILGFAPSLKTATDQILSGEIKTIDIGKVNDRYFVNVLSTGLFTDVSQKTPTLLKNTFGKIAYYFSSIQDLPSFRKINIKIDSEDVIFDDNVMILFVFNGRTAGNVDIAHRSKINDGYLDVLIIKGDNIVNTINTAFHFFVNVGPKREYPRGVVYFKARKMSISSDDDLSVDIDGELGPSLPIDVECIESGLKVIVPSK